MTPNPKPKPLTGEDTQQWSAKDVQDAGVAKYQSPRSKPVQSQQQQQPNVAVQVTGMIVILVFVLALIAAITLVVITKV